MQCVQFSAGNLERKLLKALKMFPPLDCLPRKQTNGSMLSIGGQKKESVLPTEWGMNLQFFNENSKLSD